MKEPKRYRPQDIFDSYEDYIKYLKKAYSLFQDLKKGKDPSFSKIIPEYLEVQFSKAIQTPRLYFPRNKGTVIIQLPLKPGMSPTKRAVIRSKALITFSAIVKTNEKAMAEEFAISKKLFDMR